MTDLYEVQILCLGEAQGGNAGGDAYRVEHRFQDLPDPETLVALKDETQRVYAVLYEDAPVTTQVLLTRLTNHEVAWQNYPQKLADEFGYQKAT